MNDVAALIGWLLEAPRGCPVEDCGATAAVAAISGAEVTAVMDSRGPRELTQREQRQLQARGPRPATSGAGPCTQAACPPRRSPRSCCRTGSPPPPCRRSAPTPSGAAAGGGGVPLGRALAGLGVRREPLEVLATPGQRDAGGREQVIWSAARLWLGGPVALVTECFYREFLDAYPGPWTAPCTGRRAAP